MPRTHDNGTDSDEQPVFDFSGYSHGQARAVSIDLMRAQRLAAQIDDASVFKTEDEFEDAIVRYQELVDKLESFTSSVLVSVPRAYLVDGAPDQIDWANVESLSWIRQDKFQALQQMIGEARAPENVSKNSPKR